MKTNEQLAREYEVLKRVYKQQYSRQGARTDLNGGTSAEISAEVKKPTRRAAEALGKDSRTLDHAEAVVKVIDDLAAAGKAAVADALRDKLNSSVNGAYGHDDHSWTGRESLSPL